MNNTTMMPAFAAGQLGIDWGALTSVINVQTPNDRGTSSGNGLSVYLPPPPPPGRSTVQSVASGINSRLNWDQVFGLGSQAIAAFGKNPTTQIGGLTVRAIQPAQEQPAGYQPATTGAPQVVQLPDGRLMINGVIQGAQPPGSAGAGVGQGIDGITSWISQNPFLVVGAGLAVYLLFKQPPGRR